MTIGIIEVGEADSFGNTRVLLKDQYKCRYQIKCTRHVSGI